MFTIRFVGSPPFLLILSGQAKYFFIPFKGTSKPKKERKKKRGGGGGGTNKQILNKINKTLKEEKRKKMTMYK